MEKVEQIGIGMKREKVGVDVVGESEKYGTENTHFRVKSTGCISKRNLNGRLC